MKSLSARLLLAALCSLTLLLPASGADKSGAGRASMPPPKRVVVPKLHGRLTVDGNLNEAVWAKAALLSPFVLNDGSGPEREKTAVRAWYDDQALYLGWIITDADIQATFTARDSKFWEEEVAEFFVTAGSLDRYFELQWNPLGGVFDAIISNKMDARGVSTNFTGDWSFTAKGIDFSPPEHHPLRAIASSRPQGEYLREAPGSMCPPRTPRTANRPTKRLRCYDPAVSSSSSLLLPLLLLPRSPPATYKLQSILLHAMYMNPESRVLPSTERFPNRGKSSPYKSHSICDGLVTLARLRSRSAWNGEVVRRRHHPEWLG